ncbi:hypothetical protein KYB31_20665 [Clostridium felsineum]|uniref:hypothetical protein n=1 Tax=Clostridium felsineum TaxID=36839 RepID=UPI00214D778B|nr:hypothetical protein [Clostridium felsineum]MCR3761391.1 hypothetical protein [Clostridium felsineum]
MIFDAVGKIRWSFLSILGWSVCELEAYWSISLLEGNHFELNNDNGLSPKLIYILIRK